MQNDTPRLPPTRKSPKWEQALHVLLIVLAVTFVSVRVWAEPVVFAAASTRVAVDSALRGHAATVSYGASGTIARQIAAGAPADLFISANPKWMDYLVGEGLIVPGSVRVLASNTLVLIAPEGGSTVDLKAENLSDRLGRDFFAVADPTVAPVGQYGREALTALGLWPAVGAALLPTRNTISTVATVARGEAALGLVYRSDAIGVAGIGIAAEIPAAAHSPIHYLIAPVAQGADPAGALAVLAYLTGPEGQASFTAAGFTSVGEGS